MIPVNCIVKDDPINGKFGDCFRACVASIMEMQARYVPHFFDDGCDGEEGHKRCEQWLNLHKCAPFYIAFSAKMTLQEFLNMIAAAGKVNYILFGKTQAGVPHCVVCHGLDIVHNPAWYCSQIVEPIDGQWQAMLITK
jgi:hypothetical protein